MGWEETVGLPARVGLDHVELTIPDLDQAVAFFAGVLGCTPVLSFGPIADDAGTFMADMLGVHPRAMIERIAMVRSGVGSNLELFECSAPDQRTLTQKNSDVGAIHLAFHVRNI